MRLQFPTVCNGLLLFLFMLLFCMVAFVDILNFRNLFCDTCSLSSTFIILFYFLGLTSSLYTHYNCMEMHQQFSKMFCSRKEIHGFQT